LIILCTCRAAYEMSTSISGTVAREESRIFICL
jgi:hypothetical protein